MLRPMRFAIAFCGIVGTLLAAAASSGARTAAPAAALRADVAEWSIVPSTGAIRAGRVRVTVRNLGTTVHQVVLVRTSSFDQRLPLAGSRARVPSVLGQATVPPGARTSFVVTLGRGSYLLLDNLPWHYWKGTAAAFAVR